MKIIASSKPFVPFLGGKKKLSLVEMLMFDGDRGKGIFYYFWDLYEKVCLLRCFPWNLVEGNGKQIRSIRTYICNFGCKLMAVSVPGLSAPACASQIDTNVAKHYEHLSTCISFH